MSVYFTIRNTLTKSGTFLLGHPNLAVGLTLWYLLIGCRQIWSSGQIRSLIFGCFCKSGKVHELTISLNENKLVVLEVHLGDYVGCDLV
jgi:hypothetical protein